MEWVEYMIIHYKNTATTHCIKFDDRKLEQSRFSFHTTKLFWKILSIKRLTTSLNFNIRSGIGTRPGLANSRSSKLMPPLLVWIDFYKELTAITDKWNQFGLNILYVSTVPSTSNFNFNFNASPIRHSKLNLILHYELQCRSFLDINTSRCQATQSKVHRKPKKAKKQKKQKRSKNPFYLLRNAPRDFERPKDGFKYLNLL